MKNRFVPERLVAERVTGIGGLSGDDCGHDARFAEWFGSDEGGAEPEAPVRGIDNGLTRLYGQNAVTFAARLGTRRVMRGEE